MSISIHASDFAPDRLICLAETLKQQYSDRGNIGILMFSSNEAAKMYLPVYGDGVGDPYIWARQFHASYSRDAEKHEESLVLMPMGKLDSGGFYDTKIELPVVSNPQCRLQVNRRCLVVLDELYYPTEALTSRTSGSVTLTGTIAKDGSVNEIHAGKLVVKGGGRKMNALVNEALQNFKTWRFAIAGQRDNVRITYRFVIESARSVHGLPMELALPDQVIIRANRGN